MSDKKPAMTPAPIIDYVIADARLEGQALDRETIEMVRKIVHGEMTDVEIEDWKRTRVLEIRREAAKERLRLKYLPVDFDISRVDEYERYLSMTDDQQKAFVSSMSNDEVEFWIALETARALYQDPVDRHPGSITEAKVARYPERYR